MEQKFVGKTFKKIFFIRHNCRPNDYDWHCNFKLGSYLPPSAEVSAVCFHWCWIVFLSGGKTSPKVTPVCRRVSEMETREKKEGWETKQSQNLSLPHLIIKFKCLSFHQKGWLKRKARGTKWNPRPVRPNEWGWQLSSGELKTEGQWQCADWSRDEEV